MEEVREPRRIKFIRFLFSISGIIFSGSAEAAAYNTVDVLENLFVSLTLPHPEDTGNPAEEAAILTSLIVILF